MTEKMQRVRIIQRCVIKLIKVDNNNINSTYGVFSEFIRKMTNHFFITFNEQPSSIHNVVISP